MINRATIFSVLSILCFSVIDTVIAYYFFLGCLIEYDLHHNIQIIDTFYEAVQTLSTGELEDAIQKMKLQYFPPLLLIVLFIKIFRKFILKF